jgi:endonuclease/exonuclease/phosphatase (EEP) superfamily protein YafD
VPAPGRRTSAAALATVLGLLTLPLLANPAAAGASAAQNVALAVDPVPLRVGTYNIRAGVSTLTFSTALGSFLPRADLIGLQEVSSKEKEAFLAAQELNGWAYHRGERYFDGQTPVMWDARRFEFVSARPERLTRAFEVGNEVPGKSGSYPAQYLTVVRLRDLLTERLVSVVNVHLLPGAVRAGRRWEGRPRLFERYVHEVERMAAVVKDERRWGTTFVLGDFNVGWVADERRRKPRLPFATFRRMGFKSMWATERPARIGTHNDALIDQVYTDRRAVNASVERDVVGSDHFPAVADYSLLPVV